MMNKEERINELAAECCTLNHGCVGCNLSRDNKCYIRNMAAIMIEKYEQKQSEGEWVDQNNGKYDNPIYICSVCRKTALLTHGTNNLGNLTVKQALSGFCPRCGAKMHFHTEVKDYPPYLDGPKRS